LERRENKKEAMLQVDDNEKIEKNFITLFPFFFLFVVVFSFSGSARANVDDDR